jgi:hypothetical protein
MNRRMVLLLIENIIIVHAKIHKFIGAMKQLASLKRHSNVLILNFKLHFCMSTMWSFWKPFFFADFTNIRNKLLYGMQYIYIFFFLIIHFKSDFVSHLGFFF